MNAVPSPKAISAARISDFRFMYLPLIQRFPHPENET
jgi:hypothetical protein